jgi:tetratricopeptide (TPR) repeat protein
MRRIAVAALLALVVAGVFWPILGHDFTNYDDDEYLTGNTWVQQGLTRESIRWAWTSGHIYWQPVTWMSHMLDWQLFGPEPRGHHAVSLAYHVANTLLVFLLLDRTTGAPWRSALAAALFGVHPLRVESVAWACELKDVLSTFFWLLTTHAWVGWTRRPGVVRYGLVMLGLALGLMAKPMLVTLPFTLLLLDYWPLGRLRGAEDLWPRIREKLPLLPLVVALAAITIAVQAGRPTLESLEKYSIAVRIENALVSYVGYLGMAVWPRNMAVLYVHPGNTIPLWKAIASALLLLVVTAVALVTRRRRPYLLVGWLWYLGTLVPVIGLVQAGEQAMADRFTYVPLLGIFLAVAWALPPRPILVPAVAAVLAAYVVRTRAQLPVWQDATTLFAHALAVDPNNAVAHLNLGVALAEAGHLDEATRHYEESLRLRPGYAEVVNGLGNAALDRGDPQQAIAHYLAALRIAPDYAIALNNLGFALTRLGRYAEAIPYYEHALRVDDRHALAENNLGVALARTGSNAAARAHFERALQIDPRQADAHSNLGALLVAGGEPAEGLVHIDRAIELRPNLGGAHGNRALALIALGRFAEAWESVHRARALGTEPSPEVLNALRARAPEPAAP